MTSCSLTGPTRCTTASSASQARGGLCLSAAVRRAVRSRARRFGRSVRQAGGARRRVWQDAGELQPVRQGLAGGIGAPSRLPFLVYPFPFSSSLPRRRPGPQERADRKRAPRFLAIVPRLGPGLRRGRRRIKRENSRRRPLGAPSAPCHSADAIVSQGSHMRFTTKIFAAALCAALQACVTAPAPGPSPSSLRAGARTPVTILVSIDGFRPDYRTRGVTPNLDALAASGISAAMRPSFPSKTFPNHWTLVTGLRPDRNGIVSNAMEDGRAAGREVHDGGFEGPLLVERRRAALGHCRARRRAQRDDVPGRVRTSRGAAHSRVTARPMAGCGPRIGGHSTKRCRANSAWRA